MSRDRIISNSDKVRVVNNVIELLFILGRKSEIIKRNFSNKPNGLFFYAKKQYLKYC